MQPLAAILSFFAVALAAVQPPPVLSWRSPGMHDNALPPQEDDGMDELTVLFQREQTVIVAAPASPRPPPVAELDAATLLQADVEEG